MISEIIALAADRFLITPADILGPSRTRHYALARHAVCYALRQRGFMSYPAIARALGRADHTSAINSCIKAEAYSAKSPAFRAIVNELVAYDASKPIVRRTRYVMAAVPKPAPKPKAPAEPKPLRDRDAEDMDASNRATGTKGLLAAIARYHPERLAA